MSCWDFLPFSLKERKEKRNQLGVRDSGDTPQTYHCTKQTRPRSVFSIVSIAAIASSQLPAGGFHLASASSGVMAAFSTACERIDVLGFLAVLTGVTEAALVLARPRLREEAFGDR